MLAGLRSFEGWPESAAQRKGVAAQNYLTMKGRDVAGFERWLAADDAEAATAVTGRPVSKQSEAEAKAKAAAAALVEMWRLSVAVFTAVVPEAVFDYLTITRGFRGSPHIDHKDTTHQHVMALGDFEGGQLCAEEVASHRGAEAPAGSTSASDGGQASGSVSGGRTLRIDVKNRVARVDGRGVHWVSGWEGERFSVVFFSMNPAHATPVCASEVHTAWMEQGCAAAAAAADGLNTCQ